MVAIITYVKVYSSTVSAFFQHDDRLSQSALGFAAFFETKFPIGKLFGSVESNVIYATTNVLVSRNANC